LEEKGKRERAKDYRKEKKITNIVKGLRILLKD